MNPAVIKSYARHLLGTALLALSTVQWFGADFNWKVVLTAVLVAVIPVVAKWVDNTEPAFGRGSG